MLLRSRTTLAAVLAALLIVAGCGDDDGIEERDAGGSKSEAPGDPTLGEVGFGQRDTYVQGVAVVTAPEDGSAHFVVVTMNAYDETGELIATEEQTESFSWPGQRLNIPVWFSLDEGQIVASVDADVTLSNESGEAELAPIEPVTTTDIASDEYGQVTAKFTLTNDTDEDMKDLRIGVACYDATDTIVGGTQDYPDVVGAGRDYLLEADLLVTGVPVRCDATLNVL